MDGIIAVAAGLVAVIVVAWIVGWMVGDYRETRGFIRRNERREGS